MAKANDSVDVTPGTGAVIATHLQGGKEHQVVMLANPNGHLVGDVPTYSAWSGTAITAAANKPYMHVFNATGSGVIVKMRKIFIQPSQAVNALAAQTWRIAKTSAVGTTGNTAITIQKNDSSAPAVPAQITAAHSYTAGGTQLFTYFEIPLSVEETLPAVGLAPFFNILPNDGDLVTDYILREGEGLTVINVTGGSYTWSVLAIFSIE
jgi:hypothetical protein